MYVCCRTASSASTPASSARTRHPVHCCDVHLSQQQLTLSFAGILQCLDAKLARKLRQDGILMVHQDAASLVDHSLAVVQQVLRM